MKSALMILLAAVSAVASFQRNAVWRDDGTLWQNVIEHVPGKARGYNELGLFLLNAKDYARAERMLTASLALNRYQTQVMLNLGILFEETGRIPEAVALYEQVISFQPLDPTAYYNLGLLYYRTLNDRATALAYFLKARDRDPLEPDVHLNLGNLYRDAGNYGEAEREFELYRRLK